MMADLISRRPVTPIVRWFAYPLAWSMVVLVAPAANATLLHEWQFNDGTANDTAVGGTAHGTLMGNASIVAGSLVLDGTAGTFLDLPASTIAVNAYPHITVEVWATPSSAMGTLNQFTTLFGFGQVNTTDPTLAANYLILQTHRGDNESRAAISISNDDTPFSEEDFVNGPEYNDNGKHFYAMVVRGPTHATEPNTISLYTDGQLRTTFQGTEYTPTAPYPVNGASNAISGISTEFARVGTSYPADPMYNGTVGNIRLYNEARTTINIQVANAGGEPGPLVPRLTIDRSTGTMTLANQVVLGSNVVGYSITSAAGGLNQAAWRSITDNYDGNSGGTFDADDNWTKLSAAGSKTDFSEFEFDGGNGGVFTYTLAAPLVIGDAGAWRKSIYDDALIEMRLANGTDVPVQVVYTGGLPGNLPYIRSDLNFSGTVTIDDWNIFLANAGASFSGMSAAESFAFGDLNGDLVSNRADFRLFKADYYANPANGAGSLEGLTGVPEPSTLALLMLSCAGFLPRRFRSRAVLPMIVAALAALVAQPADAAIKHRYGFNEGVIADASNRTIIDSVSGANGIVRGAGSSATASVLNLVGGPSATAAYVDLPNGMISVLTDATFSGWYTIQPDPAVTPPGAFSWGRIFDFGSTDAAATMGELTAPGGGGNGQDFLFYAPARGTNIAQQRVGFGNQDPLFGGSDGGDSGTGVYNDYDPEFVHTFGQMHHVAVVVDADGGGAGVATVATYIDGALLIDAGGGSNPNPVNYQLANLNDVNNWLGRSNWTVDANFGGSFHEFRVYDHAQNATEVTTDFICGPDILCADAVSLEVDKSNNQITLINNLDIDLPIDYYEITSAAGGLSTAGWTSIDGNTTPGQGWDKSGAANANQLIELYLPETPYTFPAHGELSIGAAFNPAAFGVGNDGDLEFTLGYASATPEGATLSGSVSYVGTVLPVAGDYNGDGIVNSADYSIWRDTLGSTTDLRANGDNTGASANKIDLADYNFWKSRFGATSGSGAGAGSSAVPEPATWALLAGGLLVLGAVGRRTTTKASAWIAREGTTSIQDMERRHTMPTNIRNCHWSGSVVMLLVGVLLTTSSYASTRDRFYQFGDDPTENPVVGQPPNTDFGDFTGDSAAFGASMLDFQDLSWAGGGPLYVHTDTTSRPGAAAGEWGLSFDGADDRLVRAGGGLGSPATGDNDVSSYGGISFTGITTRLMDGWVRPTNAALGRQDIVNDTTQFGIFISADDKWGFVEGSTTITSAAAVSFNQWTHVMHRTYTNDAGALYVNGVVVAATGNNYNAAPPATAPTLDMVFGASTDQSTNFFQGHLDNFSIYVSGNNAAQANGRDYGAVSIGTENDYIRQQLIGKPAGDVDLSGTLTPTDVSTFVANWLSVRQVNGVNVGADLVSRMRGDFNLNGVVDIDDAFTLHDALSAAGMGGLDFSLLGSGVPEPGTLVLAACGLAALAPRWRRRRRGTDT